MKSINGPEFPMESISRLLESIILLVGLYTCGVNITYTFASSFFVGNTSFFFFSLMQCIFFAMALLFFFLLNETDFLFF